MGKEDLRHYMRDRRTTAIPVASVMVCAKSDSVVSSR
jgi:hypothetical protein